MTVFLESVPSLHPVEETKVAHKLKNCKSVANGPHAGVLSKMLKSINDPCCETHVYTVDHGSIWSILKLFLYKQLTCVSVWVSVLKQNHGVSVLNHDWAAELGICHLGVIIGQSMVLVGFFMSGGVNNLLYRTRSKRVARRCCRVCLSMAVFGLLLLFLFYPHVILDATTFLDRRDLPLDQTLSCIRGCVLFWFLFLLTRMKTKHRNPHIKWLYFLSCLDQISHRFVNSFWSELGGEATGKNW